MDYDTLFDQLVSTVNEHKEKYKKSSIKLDRNEYDDLSQYHRDGAHEYYKAIKDNIKAEVLMFDEGLSLRDAYRKIWGK